MDLMILDIPNWLHSTKVAQSRGIFIPDQQRLVPWMIKSDQTSQGLQQKGVVSCSAVSAVSVGILSKMCKNDNNLHLSLQGHTNMATNNITS